MCVVVFVLLCCFVYVCAYVFAYQSTSSPALLHVHPSLAPHRNSITSGSCACTCGTSHMTEQRKCVWILGQRLISRSRSRARARACTRSLALFLARALSLCTSQVTKQGEELVRTVYSPLEE